MCAGITIFLTLVTVGCVLGADLDTDSSQSTSLFEPDVPQNILVGTVQTLTGPAGSETSDILAGYRFWVEQTNLGGGIRVGETVRRVELRVFDDKNDETLRRSLYNRLVQEEKVDFLLGAGPGTATDMGMVGSENEILSIAISKEKEWKTRPFVYNLIPTVPTQTLEFLRTMKATWGFSKVALMWTLPKNEVGMIDTSLFDQCHQLEMDQTQIGIEVVYAESIETLGAEVGLKERMTQLGAEIAIACTNSEKDAMEVVKLLGRKHILQGWNVENVMEEQTQEKVEPTFVEAETLKFLYISGGATGEAFSEHLGGWAQKVMAPETWHAEMDFSDPYFSSTHEANAIWQARYDFGNGKPMPAPAAAAIGAGTVLRASIERTASLESAAVARNLVNLVHSTIWGSVSFGPDRANVRTGQPVVQWDCSTGVNCTTRVALPSWATRRVVQPYHQACPPGEIRAGRDELFTIEYDPVDFNIKSNIDSMEGPTDHSGQIVPTPPPIPCTPCVGGGTETEVELGKLFEQGNAQQLRETCTVLSKPVQIGLLLETREADGELVAAAGLAIQDLKDSNPLLQHMQLEAVVPSSKTVREGGEEANKEAMLVLQDIAKGGERSVVVWTKSATVGLAGTSLRDVQAESVGPFLTWEGVTVSLTAPTRHQGRVLANVVEHFGWQRCHVVYTGSGSGPAMLREFKTAAEDRGTLIEQMVEIKQGDGRDTSILKAADLDDCQATVLVLLVERGEAEALFDAMVERRGERVFETVVLLGSEEASRAVNAPLGMLGVRTVARSDSEVGAGIMQDEELGDLVRAEARWTDGEYAWGSGIRDGRVAEDWWRDEIGFADRALFVYDAVSVAGKAAFNQLLSSYGQGTGIAADVEPEPAFFEEDPVKLISGPLEANANVQTLLSLEFDGATGPVRFQVHSGPDGEVLERITGRYSVVNKVEAGLRGAWRALAALDLEGTGAIIHTLDPELGQHAWEKESVVWGRAAGGEQGEGKKPEDVCECVVWEKMGPHSEFSKCRWSATAIAVVAVGAGIICGIVALLVLLSQRKHKDVQEQLVQQRIKHVRKLLKMRKRDGFALSSEARGLWFNLVQPRDFRVIQRKHMEAVARMSLLYDFEVRSFDALACGLTHTIARSWSSGAPTDTQTLAVLNEISEDASPGSSRQISLIQASLDDEQYAALRKLLLETSRLLLDPSLDELQLRSKVGRGRGMNLVHGALEMARSIDMRSNTEGHTDLRSNATSALDDTIVRATSDTVASRESCELTPAAGAALEFGETRSASSPSALARTPSALVPLMPLSNGMIPDPDPSVTSMPPWSPHSERDSMRGSVIPSMRGRKRRSDAMMIDEVLPRTVEQRFNFFAKQVALVQVWKENDQSLFKELKSGCVQEFMDTIKEACDTLFSQIFTEPGGPELVSFIYPPTPPSPSSAATQKVATLSNAPTLTVVQGSFKAEKGKGTAGSSGVFGKDDGVSGPEDAIAERGEGVVTAPSSLSTLQNIISTVKEEKGEDGTNYATIRRQDHPLVRAIRLNEEDWREVDLERSASSHLSSVKDEEVYISQLYRRAVLLNDEFQHRVKTAIERKFDTRFAVHSAPVKTKDRMREKLVSYASEAAASPSAHDPHSPLKNGDDDVDAVAREMEAQAEHAGELPLAAYILDPVRTTIVCDGPQEMVECAQWLCDQGLDEGLPAVRVKNKFACKDSSEYDGYRDLMVCVLYTGSHNLRIIGEIQIHDRRLHGLKMRMHKLYKVKRAISPDTI